MTSSIIESQKTELSEDISKNADNSNIDKETDKQNILLAEESISDNSAPTTVNEDISHNLHSERNNSNLDSNTDIKDNTAKVSENSDADKDTITKEQEEKSSTNSLVNQENSNIDNIYEDDVIEDEYKEIKEIKTKFLAGERWHSYNSLSGVLQEESMIKLASFIYACKIRTYIYYLLLSLSALLVAATLSIKALSVYNII